MLNVKSSPNENLYLSTVSFVPSPSGIFTTIPLHRTTQRLITPHPFQDILNSHTVFLNIKKSTLHVLKVFPRSCIFVLIRDCIGPCVYGPPRGAWLLRIIEGYCPPVVPEWLFVKIAAIIVILEEPDRFSPGNDDENAELVSKIINKIDHAINWLVKGLLQGLSFSTFELNSNMWNKLLFGHLGFVRMEFFNDIVRSFPPPPPPEIPERLPNLPQKESSVRKSTKQLWIHQTHDGLSPVYQWTFLW